MFHERCACGAFLKIEETCQEGSPVRVQGRAKLQEVAHLKAAEQLLRSLLPAQERGRPSIENEDREVRRST